uniref:Uncharacterized protein n=1 Tax=Rattus norvegicus TaxID=10116 RepID=A0ABK0M786_RAT
VNTGNKYVFGAGTRLKVIPRK